MLPIPLLLCIAFPEILQLAPRPSGRGISMITLELLPMTPAEIIMLERLVEELLATDPLGKVPARANPVPVSPSTARMITWKFRPIPIPQRP